MRFGEMDILNRFRDIYGVTIASVCQLAWSLVLAARTNSQNISFGNLSSGRDAPIAGVDELVGPMISMLICHADLDWDAKVADKARELQAQSVEAFDHQQTPLAAIHNALGLSRSQPLFNSTLSYKRLASIESTAGPGGAITLDGLESEDPTEYDVNVNIDASNTALEMNIQYSTAALSDAAAQRLADSLVQAIHSVCSNGERQLKELSLISTEDQAQIMKWNSTMPDRLDTCVHELVVPKLKSQPLALAVDAWEQRAEILLTVL